MENVPLNSKNKNNVEPQTYAIEGKMDADNKAIFQSLRIGVTFANALATVFKTNEKKTIQVSELLEFTQDFMNEFKKNSEVFNFDATSYDVCYGDSLYVFLEALKKASKAKKDMTKLNNKANDLLKMLKDYNKEEIDKEAKLPEISIEEKKLTKNTEIEIGGIIYKPYQWSDYSPTVILRHYTIETENEKEWFTLEIEKPFLNHLDKRGKVKWL